jgi:hypothetical protein
MCPQLIEEARQPFAETYAPPCWGCCADKPNALGNRRIMELNEYTNLRMLARSRLLLFFLVGVHPQLSHLAIKIRAVQSHAFGGLAHVAFRPLDVFLDVFDLKNIGGLGERQVRRKDGGRFATGSENECQIISLDPITGRKIG